MLWWTDHQSKNVFSATKTGFCCCISWSIVVKYPVLIHDSSSADQGSGICESTLNMKRSPRQALVSQHHTLTICKHLIKRLTQVWWNRYASIWIGPAVYTGWVTARISLSPQKTQPEAYFYASGLFLYILHASLQWLFVGLWALPKCEWPTLNTVPHLV